MCRSWMPNQQKKSRQEINDEVWPLVHSHTDHEKFDNFGLFCFFFVETCVANHDLLPMVLRNINSIRIVLSSAELSVKASLSAASDAAVGPSRQHVLPRVGVSTAFPKGYPFHGARGQSVTCTLSIENLVLPRSTTRAWRRWPPLFPTHQVASSVGTRENVNVREIVGGRFLRRHNIHRAIR